MNMGNITATYNTVDNTCVINTSTVAEVFNFLEIIFTGDTPTINFDTNLRFGYTMTNKATDTDIRSQDYPDGGFPAFPTVYTQANNGSVFNTDRYELNPDNQYTFKIWFELGNQVREFDTTFTTPKPPQPYPSWTWGDGKWNSPVPRPETAIDPTHSIDIPLQWNETAQAWEEFPIFPPPEPGNPPKNNA
jgi:hypothetical protein